MSEQRPFGLWNSPVSPKMIGHMRRFQDVWWDDDGETVVWSERRGRTSAVLYQAGTDAPYELTDDSVSPKGGVGYGGGAFTVHDGVVYFVSRGRLYRQPIASGAARPITPQFGSMASPRVSPDGRWITFVHSYEGHDCLAIVDTEGHFWPQKLISDTDFVMQPAWHPDNQQIACVTWDHPDMPWIDTRLNLLSLVVDGSGLPHVERRELIADEGQAARFQPEFSPDGRYLSFTSDINGWGHLYLYDLVERSIRQLTDGAFEYSTPAWLQGMRTYGWTEDSRALLAIRTEGGFDSLQRIDSADGTVQRVQGFDAYTRLEQIAIAPRRDHVAVIASAPTVPTRIIRSGNDGVRIIRRATGERLPSALLATARAIKWDAEDGTILHGLYYTPHNPRYQSDGKPPLMVLIHSGPTTQARAEYDLEVQFFTSRGFAVLQPNHRGSTGYGRDYMVCHQGQWGVYDVEDSIAGAQHLAATGLIDGGRMAIMGTSAGGYTVLQTLTQHAGVFKAGISGYGIGDQMALSEETHKFEKHYTDWLIGSLPEAAELYRERSPLYRAAKIRDAVLMFHGSDDPVVPQDQSDRIIAALEKNGIPHQYVVYEGEGHGFRDPDNKANYYETILRFLVDFVIRN